MRFYFHIDPDKLTPDEWIERYTELRFCLVKLDKLKDE